MITAEQYAETLFSVLQETKPKDQDHILDSFVRVLSENNDIHLYDAIEAAYRKLANVKDGITDVEITTAHSAKINSELLDGLNEIIGNKPHITYKTDESLIGGVVIRSGDTLIDGSVKHALEQLKKNIIQH